MECLDVCCYSKHDTVNRAFCYGDLEAAKNALEWSPGGHPKAASRGHFKTGHSGSPEVALI